jgi:hypothetical protein
MVVLSFGCVITLFSTVCVFIRLNENIVLSSFVIIWLHVNIHFIIWQDENIALNILLLQLRRMYSLSVFISYVNDSSVLINALRRWGSFRKKLTFILFYFVLGSANR